MRTSSGRECYVDNDPLGSGSNGLKYWQRDVLDSRLVTAAGWSSTSYVQLAVHATFSHSYSQYM